MYGDVKVILQPGKRVEAVKAAIAEGWELISVLPGGQDGERTILAYVMGKRRHSHTRREVKTFKTAVGTDDPINERLAEGWEILSATVTTDDFGDYVVYVLSRRAGEEGN